MYWPPVALFLAGMLCAGYACLVGDRMPRIQHASAGLAACCYAAAVGLARDVDATCSAIVGVALAEIEAFKAIVEAALRAADLSLTAASVDMYGKPDPGRLRHELNGDGGGLSALRLWRVKSVAFWETFMELGAEAKGAAVVSRRTLERAARVTAAVPKARPVTIGEPTCEASVSRA